jgi:CrcB protein
VAYLWIALGAVVGAAARYSLSGFITKLLPSSFPYGTLIINITGSLLLGFFLVWTTEHVLINPRWRLLIAIGFCGSYTTFSSYAFETFALGEQGQWLLMGCNVIASNLLCLISVVAGAALARWL